MLLFRDAWLTVMIQEKQRALSGAHPAFSKGFSISFQPLVVQSEHLVKLSRNLSERTDLVARGTRRLTKTDAGLTRIATTDMH